MAPQQRLSTTLERAVGAVRGQLRHLGRDPQTATRREVAEVVDELARGGHDAARAMVEAGERRYSAFVRQVRR